MFPQFGAATADSLNRASTLVFRIGTDAHLYDDPDEVNIGPLLDSRFDSEKCEALKRLLSLIAQGVDVCKFFPQFLNQEIEHSSMAAEKKTVSHQKAFGWAARDTSGILSPFNFTRRATEEFDVRIKILYCGICHSDLHMTKSDIDFPINYPIVPGHEIIGEVVEAGEKAEKFKPGDKAGVGCFVRSCGECEQCNENLENYCRRAVITYNAADYDGSPTYGGYSDTIVVHQRYVFRISDKLPLRSVAPLLCAGITVYSPMRYFGLDRPGLHIGVVGLGGLGHVAVKFAKAMGMRVTVISTSPHKREEAIGRLGADYFLVSTDDHQIEAAIGNLDGIIDTVSAYHPIAPLLGLLKAHGKLVVLGASKEPLQVPSIPLLLGRKIVSGSAAGGMKETQEMLDFAEEHNITADVEVISMDYVNTAFERLARGDVRYRFVIDVANTLKESSMNG